MPPDAAWINPIGGLGDALMLSGVLKQVHERDPSARYNLVRRTRYQSILRGHPAIGEIGFPPADARVVTTDYWAHEPLGAGRQRAFQVLARKFGLPTPVEERLYLPEDGAADDLLLDMMPDGGRPRIVVAPTSDSPRKMWALERWEELAGELTRMGTSVIQAGTDRDPRVPGTYCLLGLTTPRQLVEVLRRSALVITVDNFVMHAAHLAGTRAVALWGPTEAETYGYAEQHHLSGDPLRCPRRAECLGPRHPANYGAPCPVGPEHCMNSISVGQVREAAASLLP